MTTGEPLIVRGAMKPLPTLTKPLRSVDIATHEPAEALRERTDSCTVPAAGVVGEAMVALVLADAYRAKFGGDHIDDVRQAARRLPRADRMASSLTQRRRRRRRTARALVFIGFMGAGKSTAARRARRSARARGARQRRLLEQRFGHSIAEEFERAARRPSGRPRRSSSASCSAERRPGLGDRARRRQRPLGAGARGARAAT